jgi:hypothetical protein
MAANPSDPSPPDPAGPLDSSVRERALSDVKIRKIYDYWLKKSGDGVLPARRDIDPVDVYDCLSTLMILEVVDGGRDFRIRLAGSQVEEAHDRPLKGLMVGELGAEMKPTLERFQAVVQTREPDFRSSSLAAVGRSFIEFDRVALPLAEDGKTVTHLLCCYTQKLREKKA